MVPFALALSGMGCSAWEGTWLLELVITKADDKDQEGDHQQITGEISALADGNYAMTTGGIQLVGTIEGNTFSFERTQGNSFSNAECDDYSQESSVVIAGSFTADLGIDGTVVSKQSTSVTKCPMAGDAAETRLEMDMTGLKLNVNPDLHTSGGLTWGYNGGGGYF